MRTKVLGRGTNVDPLGSAHGAAATCQQRLDRLARISDVARRLVLELATIGLLAAVAVALVPRDHPLTGWSFVAPVVLLLLHALVGAVVVVDGVGLVVSASWTATRARVFRPALGLAGALVALGAGVGVLAGLESGSLWVPMVIGWVVAMSAYVAEWRGAARTVKVLRPVAAAPRAGRRDRSGADR